MSLFRNETPVLGQGTTLVEVANKPTSVTSTATNAYKPTTREIIDCTMPQGAQHVTQWIYQAPWKCQIVAIHENHNVVSTSGTMDVVRIQADGIAPTTANGTTIISMLTGPMSTAGTINTRQNLALSTAAGLPTILNPGDQLALVAAGTAGSYSGVIQVEVTQIG